jgi:hypothetical protein
VLSGTPRHQCGPIPDLWLTGWLRSPFGRRSTPLRVIGPVGAAELMAHLGRAYARDIAIRITDENLPPEGAATRAEEFLTDGVVYDEHGVKVIVAPRPASTSSGRREIDVNEPDWRFALSRL